MSIGAWPRPLTRLQVPEVFAAHLVAPALAVAIAAAPDVHAGADGRGAVACPGLGSPGVGVLLQVPQGLGGVRGPLAGARAQALPAHCRGGAQVLPPHGVWNTERERERERGLDKGGGTAELSSGFFFLKMPTCR